MNRAEELFLQTSTDNPELTYDQVMFTVIVTYLDKIVKQLENFGLVELPAGSTVKSAE